MTWWGQALQVANQIGTVLRPVMGVAREVSMAPSIIETASSLGPVGIGIGIGAVALLGIIALADKENKPKIHNVDCKSRKDAKDKAQEYGGGLPPEGPHHDGYGSHFHAMRMRDDKLEKIKNVHFKYKSNKPFIHKIQKGECLSQIASKYDVSMDQLAKWNNIKNKDYIIAGKTLKIY